MAINAVDALERASDDFDEASRTTHKQAGEKKARLWDLSEAQVLVAGGEVLSQYQHERESKRLRSELTKFIAEGGEDPELENVPPLQYVNPTTTALDVISLWEQLAPPESELTPGLRELDKIIRLGMLTGNKKAIEANKAQIARELPMLPVGGTAYVKFGARR